MPQQSVADSAPPSSTSLLSSCRPSSVTREQVSVKPKSRSGKVNRLVLFGPGGGVGGGVPQNEKKKTRAALVLNLPFILGGERRKKGKEKKEQGRPFFQQLCPGRGGQATAVSCCPSASDCRRLQAFTVTLTRRCPLPQTSVSCPPTMTA